MADVKDSLYSMSAKEEMIPPLNKNWMTDYAGALIKAKEENKPILLSFIGLPWCPWSEKMDQEVLSRLAFIEPMRKNFILVRFNLLEEGNEHAAVRDQFEIRELPTLVLLDSNGAEITKVGYLPKTADEFVTHFQKLFTEYRELAEIIHREDLSYFNCDELKGYYLKAKEHGFTDFRDKLYLAGLKVEQGLFFLLEQYSRYADKGRIASKEAKALRKKITARDPKNENGAHRSIALMEFQALATQRSKKQHSEKKVLEPLLTYVKKYGKEDQQHLWKIELMMTQFFFGRDNPKEALIHAKTALSKAPEVEKSHITQTIAFLESKLDNKQ